VQAVLALEPQVIAWAQEFARKENALFLGRGLHYPIALEGALKLKEISYIHAEAYPAGELKHGPLALVTAQMPVVTVAPNDALLEKHRACARPLHMALPLRFASKADSPRNTGFSRSPARISTTVDFHSGIDRNLRPLRCRGTKAPPSRMTSTTRTPIISKGPRAGVVEHGQQQVVSLRGRPASLGVSGSPASAARSASSDPPAPARYRAAQ
jgi:hypothetical protein